MKRKATHFASENSRGGVGAPDSSLFTFQITRFIVSFTRAFRKSVLARDIVRRSLGSSRTSIYQSLVHILAFKVHGKRLEPPRERPSEPPEGSSSLYAFSLSVQRPEVAERSVHPQRSADSTSRRRLKGFLDVGGCSSRLSSEFGVMWAKRVTRRVQFDTLHKPLFFSNDPLQVRRKDYLNLTKVVKDLKRRRRRSIEGGEEDSVGLPR